MKNIERRKEKAFTCVSDSVCIYVEDENIYIFFFFDQFGDLGFCVKVNNTSKKKKGRKKGFQSGSEFLKKDSSKKETEKRNEMRKKEKNEEKKTAQEGITIF